MFLKKASGAGQLFVTRMVRCLASCVPLPINTSSILHSCDNQNETTHTYFQAPPEVLGLQEKPHYQLRGIIPNPIPTFQMHIDAR